MAEKHCSAGERVVAKRSVLKSQLPLIIIAAAAVLLVITYFVYQGTGRSKCDSIFEQTADRLRGNLEFINIKGGLVLGREKVQELTEGSQKVALHLKTCCIAQQAGSINADQFQVCISGAKDYETKIVRVATNIREAKAAEEQQKPDLARQKTEQAREAANEAINTEKTLAKTTDSLVATTPSATRPPTPPPTRPPEHAATLYRQSNSRKALCLQSWSKSLSLRPTPRMSSMSYKRELI